MAKLLSVSNTDEIKKEAFKLFSSNAQARFIRRVDIICLLCSGHSLPFVSSLFNINKTTIQRWVHRVNQHGLNGLKDKQGRGRPSSLSNNHKKELKNDLKKSPSEFGYNQSKWDGKLLSHHLDKNYNVNLKIRQCQNLFKELISPIQTQRLK